MLTGVRLKEKARMFEKKMQGPAHTIRLSIIYLLAHGELPLHEIVLDIDKPQNLVSHHMKVLEKSGWVGKRVDGREVYYRLIDRGFFELTRLLVDTPFYHTTLMKRLK